MAAASSAIPSALGRELIRQLRLEFIPYGPEELGGHRQPRVRLVRFPDALRRPRHGLWRQLEGRPGESEEQLCGTRSATPAMYEIYQQSVDFLKKKTCSRFPLRRRRMGHVHDVARTPAREPFPRRRIPDHLLSHQQHEL